MWILISCLLHLGTVNVPADSPSTAAVSFTLLNRSARSIPLYIPRVMNPNLSPFSSSGVTLRVGQEIQFRYRGRREVLLVVDRKLEGQKLVVNQLLSARRAELAKKKK